MDGGEGNLKLKDAKVNRKFLKNAAQQQRQ